MQGPGNPNALPGPQFVRPVILANTANLKAAEVAPANRRLPQKKKKAADRPLPEKVFHAIPESSLFNHLLVQERRLDSCIKRRRLDLQEAVYNPEHSHRRLRVYLYNTLANQGQSPSSNEPPSWTFCMYGRLLDQPEPAFRHPGQPMSSQVMHAHRPGFFFTSLMKKITIDIVPSSPREQQQQQQQQPQQVQQQKQEQAKPLKRITWEKQLHKGPHKDMLEVHQVGKDPVCIRVELEVDWMPMRYLLPPALAEALQLQYETRSRITAALWTYVVEKRLQSPQQPTMLQLPPALAECFGQQEVEISSLNTRLAALLKPMGPITLSYDIKLDGPSPSAPACYDIIVELPMKGQDKLTATLDSISIDKEIDAEEQKIAALIHNLNDHRRRRNFFLGFSTSPVDFINAIIASQARDLRVLKGITGRDFELERRTDTFKDKWVEEAVVKYLMRQSGVAMPPM